MGLQKKDFSYTQQDTFFDCRSKSMDFHGMLCIFFRFLTMPAMSWDVCSGYQVHISILKTGESTFCQSINNRMMKNLMRRLVEFRYRRHTFEEMENFEKVTSKYSVSDSINRLCCIRRNIDIRFLISSFYDVYSKSSDYKIYAISAKNYSSPSKKVPKITFFRKVFRKTFRKKWKRGEYL